MTTKGQQSSLFEIKKYAQKGLYLWPSDAAYLLSALDPPALGPMLIREEKLVVQAHVMACEEHDFLGCVRYRDEWLDVYRINWFAGIGLNLMKFTGNQAVVVAYYVDLVENEPVKLVPPHSSK